MESGVVPDFMVAGLSSINTEFSESICAATTIELWPMTCKFPGGLSSRSSTGSSWEVLLTILIV